MASVPGNHNKACRHLSVGGGAYLPFVCEPRGICEAQRNEVPCTKTLISLSGLSMGSGRRHLQGTGLASLPESSAGCPMHCPWEGVLGPKAGSWADPALSSRRGLRLRTGASRPTQPGFQTTGKQLITGASGGGRKGLWEKPVGPVVGHLSGHRTPGPTRHPKGTVPGRGAKPSPVADRTHIRTLVCTQPTLSPTRTHLARCCGAQAEPGAWIHSGRQPQTSSRSLAGCGDASPD